MCRKILVLSITLLSFGLSAQVDSLGEWRTLQSYRFGTYVTESSESIIYTTGRAIFFLDKQDLSITRLAREDGLAEARIRLIRYHEPTETMIIVYESSVIDLLRNGQFSTLRQIDNFNFSGDKQIYEMYFGDDNIVYLAAGFGISALDLDEETFPFTTFTGVRVNGTALFDGLLYAATEEGIYRAPIEGVNLNDFGNWEFLVDGNGFPGDYTSTAINVYQGQLYFGINEDVYRLENDSAVLFYDADDRPWRLQYLSIGPNLMLAGYRCTDASCSSRQLIFLDENGQRRRVFAQCIIRTNYAIEDEQGRIWFAEDESSPRIRFFESISDGDCNEIEYNGPRNDRNYRLLHDGNSLWVAPGVLDENFSASFSFGGVYRFKDEEWTFINRDNNALFRGRNGELQGDDDVASIVDVHYDDVNDEYWFSSFFEGAISYRPDTEEGSIVDELNSPLQGAIGDLNRIRVVGAVTDPQGFTYLANSRAEDGEFISVRSPEGEWAALAGNCNNLNDALAIEIDQSGYIWVVHATSVGGGITVLDVAGTPMDPSDDRCRTILASNSALPSNNVRSIAIDLDGNVWVGTDQGIILFECGSAVFETDICPGRLPVASADGFGAFLLETEEIRSITVDGGNRKWIGTSGGAYLLSPDGEEQILFFDQGNSPLLDNTVRDIAIDPTSGVVYFGTELGIISYRAEATSATRRFSEDLVIFPNPVEPGQTGPIAISGLARDARVKITDLSGKLVAEGTATGGQFIWSGTDYNGRRVTSGIYLIFASSNGRFGLANPDSAAGKIVFLR